MRRAGHTTRIGEWRGIYRILLWKTEGKGHLEDPGIDGIIFYEDGSSGSEMGGMDWIDLAQDRDRLWALVNAVMNLRVP